MISYFILLHLNKNPFQTLMPLMQKQNSKAAADQCMATDAIQAGCKPSEAAVLPCYSHQ